MINQSIRNLGYETPKITLFQIAVEQGFALTARSLQARTVIDDDDLSDDE